MAAKQKKESKHNSNNDSKRKSSLNQREVDLISDLLTQGWSESDIQLRYGLSWNTIMKAKEEMARQAREYYSNKDFFREELTRIKQIMNDTIASMDSIIEGASTKPGNRRKAEKLKAERMEDLQDILAAESSPDQEQALRETIQLISKRLIAKNPNGILSQVEKALKS